MGPLSGLDRGNPRSLFMLKYKSQDFVHTQRRVSALDISPLILVNNNHQPLSSLHTTGRPPRDLITGARCKTIFFWLIGHFWKITFHRFFEIFMPTVFDIPHIFWKGVPYFVTVCPLETLPSAFLDFFVSSQSWHFTEPAPSFLSAWPIQPEVWYKILHFYRTQVRS